MGKRILSSNLVTAMRKIVLALAIAVLAVPASARFQRVKSLHCSGSRDSFTLIFNHEEQRATRSGPAGMQTFRFEPQGAFLTWRLIDDDGLERYILREGDAVDGDFGWYFSMLTTGPDGAIEVRPGGTCEVLE